MSGNRTIALVFVALLVVSTVGPTMVLGQAIIKGEPRLHVDAPDRTLTPGTTNQLELQISNNGDIDLGSPESRDVVTAARNVRVEVETDDDDAPIEIETGRQAIGTVTESDPRTVTVDVTVPEGTDPSEYELDVELKYGYSKRIERDAGVMNDRRRTVTRSVDVEVDDTPRFEITNVSTDVQIGDRGVLDATIENIGTQTARDVSLGLGAETGAESGSMITFGGGRQDFARAGTLEPGEQTVVRYDVSVDGGASVREFALDGTVRYTDPDGIEGVDEDLSAGVEPVAEQEFSLEDINSTLRVGEEGEIRGTVTNEGPRTARNTVVQFTDSAQNVVPIEDAVAVGTLEAGESTDFELPMEVTSEAEAVQRNFDMAVGYRNADNERRSFEDVDATVGIAESRDEFTLDIAEQTLVAGSGTLVDVQVTNNLDEPVSDVEAKLYTDDPLDSEDDEGYVERLDPGETTTVSFRLSADSGAAPRTYPIQMDFRYDDESGTSTVSDTYRTAVVVTEAEEEGPPWLIVGALVALIVAVGAGLYWRRTRD